MLIFTSYILFIGLLRFSIISNKKLYDVFTIISGFLLFLICALRTIDFAPDVVGYVNKYISLSNVNLSTLLSNFINNVGKDPFFYLFAKTISLMGFNYQAWLAIIALFFCWAITKLIKSYSPEPFISFLSLISLGFLYFSLTGLRQTMALSMIIFSYKYLKENKFIPFFILVILGSFFHTSAIIFLIIYPIKNMKINYKHFIIPLVALFIAYFFKDFVLKLLEFLNLIDGYSGYLTNNSSLNLSGFIIQFFIFLFCYVYKKNILNQDEKDNVLYNLVFLGLFFQAFSLVIAEFFRVSMYFSVFSIILIPKAIMSEHNMNMKNIVYLFVLLSLTLYFLWTSSFSGFKFFWQ